MYDGLSCLSDDVYVNGRIASMVFHYDATCESCEYVCTHVCVNVRGVLAARTHAHDFAANCVTRMCTYVEYITRTNAFECLRPLRS